MLTFDEFRAVSNREKARTSGVKPTVAKKGATARAKVDNNVVDSPFPEQGPPPIQRSFVARSVDSIGEFLELHQMQSLYVLLIILDTFASVAEMYLIGQECLREDDELQEASVNRKVMIRMLQSFSTFVMFFFAAEIVAVVSVFGRSMMTHWGYLLDIATTSAQIYSEVHQYGKISRLLNIFRFWRMARLMTAMVSTEKDAHDRTARLLERSEVEVKKLQLDTTNLRTEVEREKEARDAIEDMLQNYKEEVDTLNEALKIAAMDIAEVAQTEDDFGISDEGDSQDELSEVDAEDAGGHRSGVKGDNDEGFVDAATSKYSRVGNKSAVMRAVMEDGNNSVQSRGSTLTAGSSHNYGASTFLVHEDGTFEQK
jgi:hypothetical protein